jgi:regulator of sigma E protease
VEVLAFTFSFSNMVSIALAALGLGLVIFIHELGHFAVAKWCGVKVERFSIGFGPILWRKVRGETEYALSAIPFGGYVKMLGQDDANPNEMADESIAKDPRSYTAKSVPQRIAIISAGVINNMISAVFFFIIAFMFGVQVQPAVIGHVTPGMPGWEAGLRQGDKITRINKREGKELTFTDIRLAVALSNADEQIEIMGLRHGRSFTTKVKPVLRDDLPFPTIFVEPDASLILPEPRDEDAGFQLTSPGLSASQAQPPFEPGDELKELDGHELDDYAQLAQELAVQRDRTVEFGVRRKGAAKDAPLTRIKVGPNHFRVLGMRMAIGQIKAIQRGSPADGKLKVGDTITHILSPEQKTVGVELDPLRLPDYFAGLAGQEVRVRVKREATGGNPIVEEVALTPDDLAGWTERPDTDDYPMSIPSLGVAAHVLHHVVEVDADGPAANRGLKKDDNLQKVQFVYPKIDGQPEKKPVTIEFGDVKRNWPAAFWFMQRYPECKVMLTFKSQGGEKETTVEVVPQVDEDWYLPMRGLGMQPLFTERRAENIGEAVQLGFRYTRDSLEQMWLTIRGLVVTRRISPKALSGPIRIAETAYSFSKQGIPDLSLFLGILSVSLAVLNFLPIPVLDGGHFMFLCLMVWVLYMDISSHL